MNVLIIEEDEKHKHVMFRCGLDAHASCFVQYLEQYKPQGLNVSRLSRPSYTNTKIQKVTNCSRSFCVHIGLRLRVKCKIRVL